MKTFNDLCIGDKIYSVILPDLIDDYIIEEITNTDENIIFFVDKKRSAYFKIRNNDINKSFSVSRDIVIFVDMVITDPEILKWFDLKI